MLVFGTEFRLSLEIGNKDIHYHLVEAAKRYDQGAQFELYNLYVKAMLNVSFRIVNDRDEAEDVIQDAFVNVFKNIDKYRGESTFGAWVKRIVINASINVLKKKKLDLVDMDQAGGEIDESFVEDEESLSLPAIKSAIMQLPEGFRAVLSLYLLEGYDHKEIGTVLGITESTSKSQFNRAKKKLREILKERYQYER
ncbi:RNA polymerase sigma-70 factor, ECF subfamily [Reichenbachiella faecimaris]|uniref:RNA polymerase sigma-70 factor, ECF subfamily n=1 Tax=Reichenbachiella faecimaris TaxID=692418 RepID=A0A1W2G867_REIFA|nr:RNA polymerase sigma-70 factor, ECF subfamily [Reichenbachiella faecimaris]